MSLEKINKDMDKATTYGHGTTVGYTDDGFVFLMIDTKGKGGEPLQLRIIWPVIEAAKIMDHLADALDKAKDRYKLKLAGG